MVVVSLVAYSAENTPVAVKCEIACHTSRFSGIVTAFSAVRTFVDC